MTVHGAQTNVHFHVTGSQVVKAATRRARNTTIAIGADQKMGTLLIDIDVQQDTCADVKELREQLTLILEALEGKNPFGDD